MLSVFLLFFFFIRQTSSHTYAVSDKNILPHTFAVLPAVARLLFCIPFKQKLGFCAFANKRLGSVVLIYFRMNEENVNWIHGEEWTAHWLFASLCCRCGGKKICTAISINRLVGHHTHTVSHDASGKKNPLNGKCTCSYLLIYVSTRLQIEPL